MEIKCTVREDRLWVFTQLKSLTEIQKRIIAPILVNHPDISRNSIEYKTLDHLENYIMCLSDRIQALIEENSGLN